MKVSKDLTYKKRAGKRTDPKKRVVRCEKCKRRCHYNFSRGASFIGFRCANSECAYQVELKATEAECRFLEDEHNEMMRGSTAIHAVSHAFQRKFQKRVKAGKPFKIDGIKKPFQPTKTVWRWKGYELMKRIEKYAEEHPEITIVVVVDDYFASSYLVLIPHNDEKTGSYFGTSVVYVPQCTGEDPIVFFLYPGHAHGLLGAFKKLQKTYRGVVRSWS